MIFGAILVSVLATLGVVWVIEQLCKFVKIEKDVSDLNNEIDLHYKVECKDGVITAKWTIRKNNIQKIEKLNDGVRVYFDGSHLDCIDDYDELLKWWEGGER